MAKLPPEAIRLKRALTIVRSTAPPRPKRREIRSKSDLIDRAHVENATLRHQLSVLRRTSGRPRLGLSDRLRLLMGAAFLPAWRKAIVVVQPETILKWPSWRTTRMPRGPAISSRHDILFRQAYAFFIVHLGSRKVVYPAARRNPTQEWTAQQLRNATMDGETPKILLRNRDDKYGPSFDRVAAAAGTRVIKTAVRAPNMNAVAERFVGSARREILDHVIILDDRHLGRLVDQYKEHFNEARPHQGIGQRIPGKPAVVIDIRKPIVTKPVLGGLHHDYRRAA